MAYLREYRMLAAAGDPGFGSFLKRAFRVPKGIRKMQPGKVLGRALPAVASVIPGVGPIVSRFMPPAPPITPAVPGFTPEFLSMMDQLRALGIVGDPGFFDMIGAKLLPGAVGALKAGASKLGGWMSSPLGKVLVGGAVSGGVGAGIGALIGGRGGGGGGARSYRRMNVGNVKALRRSMRRVEGFSKLARQTISFTNQTRMKKRRGRKR